MSHRLWETCYLGLIYVCDVGVLHSKAPFIDNVIGVQARRSNDTKDTEPASFRSDDAGWVSGSSPGCHRPTHLGHGQWHGSIRKGPVRRANSADIPVPETKTKRLTCSYECPLLDENFLSEDERGTPCSRSCTSRTTTTATITT